MLRNRGSLNSKHASFFKIVNTEYKEVRSKTATCSKQLLSEALYLDGETVTVKNLWSFLNWRKRNREEQFNGKCNSHGI